LGYRLVVQAIMRLLEMSMLAIITLLTGAPLGMRFKVLVLVPAVTLAIVAVFAGGIAHHEEAGSIGLAMLVAIIGLQLGYLGGLGASQAVIAVRAARVRRAVPHTRRTVSGHAH
jgi:hypothetical protein